jgi:hypothetical protein
MTNSKNKNPLKASPMKAMRLAEASKELAGINFDQTREMTPREQASWARAKRGPGRPRKPAGEKAARVLVTLAPDLLAAADGYARRTGISRAELIARGLLTVLAKDRGTRKTG